MFFSESVFAKYIEYSDLRKYKKLAEKIINYQKRYLKNLSNNDLSLKSDNFRQRYLRGEKLDNLLVEAFAIFREMAWRFTGLEAYLEQIIAGIAVYEGKIAEVKTGEGKTLIVGFAAYLRGITGQGVHVVTTNDYLAKRDTEWLGPVYQSLGLQVSVLQKDKTFVLKDSRLIFGANPSSINDWNADGEELIALNPESTAMQGGLAGQATGPIIARRSFNTTLPETKGEISYVLVLTGRTEGYKADITYGTNHEFGFDYLKDNMALQKEEIRCRRPFYFAIVDEVDSILIDEAQTPLIVSQDQKQDVDNYVIFNNAIKTLTVGDYEFDEKNKTAVFTDQGIEKLEKLLNIQIYNAETPLYAFHAEVALRSYLLFKKDEDYIVQNGKIILVNEFTGRLMPGHKYEEGVQQAIEAKEGLPPSQESLSLALITLQSFFKLYRNFGGLSATVTSSAEEFEKIYQKKILSIPTHKKSLRIDNRNIFYKSQAEKVNGIINQIINSYQLGRPVLLATSSIQESEVYSNILKQYNLNFETLNAKNAEKEAQIVAEAGKVKKLTVATNMAGRGTDIKLDDQSRALGGLEVIATSRNESRRIDDQLIGRAGRQGDPGSSQFHVSLDDEIFRLYLPEHQLKELKSVYKSQQGWFYDKKTEESLLIAQSIAQSIAEEERKNIYEQDMILDIGRRRFYNLRQKILFDEYLEPEVKQIFKNEISRQVMINCKLNNPKEWRPDLVFNYLESFVGRDIYNYLNINQFHFPRRKVFQDSILDYIYKKYDSLCDQIDIKERIKIERKTILQILDTLWVDYLKSIKYMDEIMVFVTYGKSNPLYEMRVQADIIYRRLEAVAGEMVLKILFRTLLKLTNQVM